MTMEADSSAAAANQRMSRVAPTPLEAREMQKGALPFRLQREQSLVISDFQLPEVRDHAFLLLLWTSVKAALENQCVTQRQGSG